MEGHAPMANKLKQASDILTAEFPFPQQGSANPKIKCYTPLFFRNSHARREGTNECHISAPRSTPAVPFSR